jgi:sialate O-acetylesterase
MVAAIDLTLDDLIHVGAQDLKRLGRRLATLAIRDLFPKAEGGRDLKKGPRPVSARFSEDGTIRIEFDHVNGKLHAPGRISGFTVHGPDGKVLPSVFDARFDPTGGNVVVLKIQRAFREPVGKGGGERAWYLPEGATLHHGYGKDPYCNVMDEADMAVPAFGPMKIE